MPPNRKAAGRMGGGYDLGLPSLPAQWGLDSVGALRSYPKMAAFSWIRSGNALFRLHQGDDSPALDILYDIDPDSMAVDDRFVSGYLNYQDGPRKRGRHAA